MRRDHHERSIMMGVKMVRTSPMPKMYTCMLRVREVPRPSFFSSKVTTRMPSNHLPGVVLQREMSHASMRNMGAHAMGETKVWWKPTLQRRRMESAMTV